MGSQEAGIQASSQQPLSLMTINLNPNRREDLLIMRILEASERKKQLIKKLLSPEEFESLAFDQYTHLKHDTLKTTPDQKRSHQAAQIQEVEHQSSFLNENKTRCSYGIESRLPKTSKDLHGNLAKKREALEFFFKEQTNSSTVKHDNLAIELRSGYYLSSSPQQVDTGRMIKSPPFSLTDLITGLLGFIGIALPYSKTNTSPLGGDQFDCLRDGIQICEPYTRERNLDVMKTRLEADGDLHKILKEVNNNQWPIMGSKFSNLIDLAKMHKNHVVSSESLGSQVRLVQPVGHFNTIQLAGPQKFTAPLRIELLVSEPNPIPPLACLGQTARQDLSKLNIKFLPNGSEFMRLKLSKLVILNHAAMLAEDRAAFRVIDQLLPNEKSIKAQRDQLLRELDKHIKLYIQMAEDSLDVRLKLKQIFGDLIGSMEQLMEEQREIMVCARELESIRQEQKFNSTSISIKIRNHASSSMSGPNSLLINLITALNNSLSSKFKEQSTEYINLNSRFLEEYEKHADRERSISYELDKNTLTPDDKCPVEEAQRRRQVRDWLKSLRLRFLLDDQYVYECQPKNESKSISYSLNIDDKINIPTSRDSSLAMKIELYIAPYRLMPFKRRIKAQTNIQLPVDATKSYQINLPFDDEIGLAHLELESDRPRSSWGEKQQAPRCKSAILMDRLYRKIFRTNHWMPDDSNSKFSSLLNKCDTSIVIQLLGHKTAPLFELDPFIDNLETPQAVFAGRCHLNEKWVKSTRQALIVWRWINNVQQLVYLSERENVKNHGLQLEEFESKLESVVAPRHESGYKSIEQLRACAVDYIKGYEAQLKEILKYRASEQGQHPTTKLKEMLREPELKVDLSGIVRAARSFVPRRSARRPLLPKRQSAGGVGHGMLKALPLSLSLDPPEPLAVPILDTEAQDTRWQRLMSGHGTTASGQLQLVVTVQQATDLPMRVIQTRPISPSPRPNSPFAAASPASSFMTTQLIQSAVPVHYLMPPTSYVEIVFQRRQQASSLAQGKSPAWNETLFFPVDVATPPSNINDSSLTGASKDQLVDEFLQLNLYDYHCYLQDNPDCMRSQEELSTLPMVSNDPSSLDNINSIGLDGSSAVIRAQRMQSARQRIERHLLGSLRVPLSTLMSNGRIEGSFALNQPLLLENYQFEPENSLSGDMRAALLPPTSRASPTMMVGQDLRKRNPETHISLFITLDPPISMPIHLLHLPTGSHEPDRVLELARLWEFVVVHHRHRATISQSTGPRPFARKARPGHRLRQSRHVRALVLQRDAKYCLISRLLVALRPADELLDNKQDKKDSMRSLARFVALLSPLKYGLFGMRLLASSLWFDSVHLIDKNLGGPEEKAVLLCNYFLHLGISSALLLGDAIPEGRCVYVISWHEQSRFIDDQLQLQAATLLESINTLATGSPPNPQNPSSRPVDKSHFISRLPVLMNANSIQLWDPNSGKSYSLTVQIPLISVGSIVTMENVYANIQSVENPCETNYDIRFKHLWFPLFESSSSSGTANTSLGASKQNPQMSWRRQLLHLEAMRKSVGRPILRPLLSPDTQLNYGKFSLEECNELKEAIERVIKSHLLKWRPDRPTYFNRTLSRLLADKLAVFENHILDQASGDHKPDWRSELADLIKNEVLMAHLSSTGLNTRQVISCPINLPYTSMKTIVDSIFASGVHNADLMLETNQQSNSSSQFLVACHVHPYPARVMSVWLYVAAIIPNTKGLSQLLMA